VDEHLFGTVLLAKMDEKCALIDPITPLNSVVTRRDRGSGRTMKVTSGYNEKAEKNLPLQTDHPQIGAYSKGTTQKV